MLGRWKHFAAKSPNVGTGSEVACNFFALLFDVFVKVLFWFCKCLECLTQSQAREMRPLKADSAKIACRATRKPVPPRHLEHPLQRRVSYRLWL